MNITLISPKLWDCDSFNMSFSFFSCINKIYQLPQTVILNKPRHQLIQWNGKVLAELQRLLSQAACDDIIHSKTFTYITNTSITNISHARQYPKQIFFLMFQMIHLRNYTKKKGDKNRTSLHLVPIWRSSSTSNELSLFLLLLLLLLVLDICAITKKLYNLSSQVAQNLKFTRPTSTSIIKITHTTKLAKCSNPIN